MTAQDVTAAPAATSGPTEAPYVVRRQADAPASPLVFASPHSGRFYPADMMDASLLDAAAIRLSEDALVDQLISGAVDYGATTIAAAYARAYIDVNREPYELDASMFEDELPDYARGRSARVAAGLGSIARIVAEGQEIYARKLTFAEARRRIETVHQPYHDALAALLDETREAFGHAVLIDWHSMPQAAARTYAQSGEPGPAGAPARGVGEAWTCDLVLGDRFGQACNPAITALVERELDGLGYKVARNSPYAGGFTTEFYGKPKAGVHALQVEINRALYMDEATLEPTAGFERLKADLERVFAALAGVGRDGFPDHGRSQSPK